MEFQTRRAAESTQRNKFFISVSTVNASAFVLNALFMENTKSMMSRLSRNQHQSSRLNLKRLWTRLRAALRTCWSERVKLKKTSGLSLTRVLSPRDKYSLHSRKSGRSWLSKRNKSWKDMTKTSTIQLMSWKNQLSPSSRKSKTWKDILLPQETLWNGTICWCSTSTPSAGNRSLRSRKTSMWSSQQFNRAAATRSFLLSWS